MEGLCPSDLNHKGPHSHAVVITTLSRSFEALERIIG